MTRIPRPWLAAGLALAALGGAFAWWWTRPDPGDLRLKLFVHARPPVPVVFTSRSQPASFAFAAPEGEGFTSPGQRLWAAREGRLRLLTPGGAVHELTLGKQLPDGGTLIDVMSPSVSLDGKRILFAGRKSGEGEGGGRFRLYEIGVDGSGLRALTGGPGDEGCTDLPPLRWAADGGLLPDAERRAIDYDDVDPIELNYTDRRVAFVSSRTPDLGRDHARRSTILWILLPNGVKHPLSGNRNNDRWPFLLSSRYLAFSLWSRNREVITADLSDIRPYESGMACATRPTDSWLGAFTQVPGGHFGMLVKPDLPVWRPRPLFVNRIAFMTTFAEPGSYGDSPPLTVVQAPPGLVASAPSSRWPDRPLPRSDVVLRRGPTQDAEGRTLWLATPGPCPPSHILLAGVPLEEGEKAPRPGNYGLYLASDDWPQGEEPASAAGIDLKLLFDDPDFVDAEPVAVYLRKIALQDPGKVSPVPSQKVELALANGRAYRGPVGNVLATALDSPSLMGDLPGQRTDAGEGLIFAAPPPEAIDHLRIFAARRDRFDDPSRPRVLGEWEFILEVPVKKGTAAVRVPTDTPTVLAGFDKAGRVAHWTTAARDSKGRQASFYAYAGDHYSLAQPNGKHFCTGCHPGHSGLDWASHDHSERIQ